MAEVRSGENEPEKQSQNIELSETAQAGKPTDEKNNASIKVKETKNKIDVLLKAAGDAPIMKKKKWAVDPNKTVAYLVEFIRKYIKCTPSDSLFLYVNQCFVPYPDQLIQNLYECFGADGKLVLYYCKTQAWG